MFGCKKQTSVQQQDAFDCGNSCPGCSGPVSYFFATILLQLPSTNTADAKTWGTNGI